MTKRWEKVKVADLKDGDVVKVCGIVASRWCAYSQYFWRFYKPDGDWFCALAADAIVKRKITKPPTEPKPKRYIVEVRSPKEGDRCLSAYGKDYIAIENPGERVVVVEELT